jgi:hypothetical protein
MIAVLLAAFVVSSCAHAPAAWQAEATWEGKCYAGMRDDALRLAAPGARDCGFAAMSGRALATRTVKACVKAALRAGEPFIAGFQGIGTDSGYCESVATLPGGRWGLLDVDYDRTGGVNFGDGPVLAVLECAAVTTSGAVGQPFVHSQCERSSALGQRLSP